MDLVRHGFEVQPHYLSGIYLCTPGRNPKRPQSSSSAAGDEMICTLQECTCCEEEYAYEESATISVFYGGLATVLSPWDPQCCALACAIEKRLVLFPIRRGSHVFAIGCSLSTLSHIADILGRKGKLIGVLDDSLGAQPATQEQVNRFARRYPQATIVSGDVQSSSLEGYMRLLSVPASSKYAFLMAMHPRLGARSGARVLAKDRVKLVGRIFGFLTCNDVAEVRCLVATQWPAETKGDAIRETVLSHIAIFQQWRALCGQEDGPKRGFESVLLCAPTDGTVSSSSVDKLIGCTTKVQSEVQKGLSVKEKVLLSPHFPSRSFLLLKYSAHRSDKAKAQLPNAVGAGGSAEEPLGSSVAAAAGAARSSHEPAEAGSTEAEAASSVQMQQPSSGSLPVPTFGAGFGRARSASEQVAEQEERTALPHGPPPLPALGGRAPLAAFGGAPPAPAFGGAPPAPAFGGAPAAPAFGGAPPAPAFGGAPAAPAFGGAPAAPAFGGAPPAPAFGGAPPLPAFGSRLGALGGAPGAGSPQQSVVAIEAGFPAGHRDQRADTAPMPSSSSIATPVPMDFPSFQGRGGFPDGGRHAYLAPEPSSNPMAPSVPMDYPSFEGHGGFPSGGRRADPAPEPSSNLMAPSVPMDYPSFQGRGGVPNGGRRADLAPEPCSTSMAPLAPMDYPSFEGRGGFPNGGRRADLAPEPCSTSTAPPVPMDYPSFHSRGTFPNGGWHADPASEPSSSTMAPSVPMDYPSFQGRGVFPNGRWHADPAPEISGSSAAPLAPMDYPSFQDRGSFPNGGRRADPAPDASSSMAPPVPMGYPSFEERGGFPKGWQANSTSEPSSSSAAPPVPMDYPYSDGQKGGPTGYPSFGGRGRFPPALSGPSSSSVAPPFPMGCGQLASSSAFPAAADFDVHSNGSIGDFGSLLAPGRSRPLVPPASGGRSQNASSLEDASWLSQVNSGFMPPPPGIWERSGPPELAAVARQQRPQQQQQPPQPQQQLPGRGAPPVPSGGMRPSRQECPMADLDLVIQQLRQFQTATRSAPAEEEQASQASYISMSL